MGPSSTIFLKLKFKLTFSVVYINCVIYLEVFIRNLWMFNSLLINIFIGVILSNKIGGIFRENSSRPKSKYKLAWLSAFDVLVAKCAKIHTLIFLWKVASMIHLEGLLSVFLQEIFWETWKDIFYSTNIVSSIQVHCNRSSFHRRNV